MSRPAEAAQTARVAVERAAEALDAEFGVLVVADEIGHAMGFGPAGVPAEFIAARDGEQMSVADLGEAYLACGELGSGDGRTGTANGRLVVGRLSENYTAEEQQLLQGMALVLGLVLDNVAKLDTERERHRLLETLLEIQRAISARQPLAEVLDAITAGASALLGGCPVALLLGDPRSPAGLKSAANFGFPDVDPLSLRVARRALTLETSVSVPEPRSRIDDRIIAERVTVGDRVVGCLVARPVTHSQKMPGTGGDPVDLLSAFAQQVNLALTDAETLDAVRQAHRDPITDLPNRALFLEILEKERLSALRLGHRLTVLFIDLDRFKAVNDSLGHQAGDELLAEVAQRIGTCLRAGDNAARLGGDEFSISLQSAESSMGAGVAERIIDVLTQTFTISGREVLIGASVGIASLTSAHESASDLLSDADVAMYYAKRAGRGSWAIFEPQMQAEVISRLELRTDLQKAQANNELWMAYQPIISISSLQIEGVEALMRWSHPTRGEVSPALFIPIAEESATIGMLGAWAIKEAVTQVAGWRAESSSLGLSLNVSGRQVLDPVLPQQIAAALAQSGMSAGALTLEITESLLMDDPEVARTRLIALKNLGVRLAIDDFGTGYSSLSYLRQFPVDEVKLDRSFVAGLRAGAIDEISVVRGILELCRSLRLQTVAEGIENPEQLAILADLGCDLAQGYYFSRPVPPQAHPPHVDRCYTGDAPVGHPKQPRRGQIR